jgi:hypothetical protein
MRVLEMTIRARLTTAWVWFAAVAMLSIASAEAATMTLRWDPNPDSVLGYRVWWGTSSGQYNRTVDVGNQTSFQFEAPTPPTTYYFIVTAYDSAGHESTPSLEVNTGPAPLRLTDIGANPAAPQLVGTTITFRATATGGIPPYHYKWRTFDGTTWSSGAEWSTDSTFAWRPESPNADYRVGVWVRSSTSTGDAPDNADAESSIPFAITGPSSTLLTIGTGKVPPQSTHTAIKFTANVAGAGTYRYKWWVFDGLSWHIKKEWGRNNTFTWTPFEPSASYHILVRAQNVTDPTDTGGASIPFPIVSKRPGSMGAKDLAKSH